MIDEVTYIYMEKRRRERDMDKQINRYGNVEQKLPKIRY